MSSDIIEPTTLVVRDNTIYDDTQPPVALYTASQSLTSLPKGDISSIKFHRVAENDGKPDDSDPAAAGGKPLFYLVHPLHADYRTDKPAYYMTSISRGGAGNIRLEASKPSFPAVKKAPQLTAHLSRNKSADDSELFAAEEELLFTIKSNWNGSTQTWTDAKGQEVAVQNSDDKSRLIASVKLEESVRDSLVAFWALCLWREMAEHKDVKREALEKLTPAQPQGQGDGKMWKRTGAMGGFAAGGGGGG
ncbi:hypothetical protein K4F52_008961 [Lecanicillium sp. MT-2017a]|nr:hypothetical protein K4F52_008961 [Lecanicillium sp. MT-2017a]